MSFEVDLTEQEKEIEEFLDRNGITGDYTVIYYGEDGNEGYHIEYTDENGNNVIIVPKKYTNIMNDGVWDYLGPNPDSYPDPEDFDLYWDSKNNEYKEKE